MLRHALIASFAAVAVSCPLAASAQDHPLPKTYENKPQTTPPQAPGKQTVAVTGCLAQGADQGTFVLTALPDPLASQMSQKMSGTVPSPTYQLFGGTDQLKALVGHRVEVKGTTNKQPDKTVQLGNSNTNQASPRAEGTSGKTPTVTTETKEKIELRRLDVQSVRSVEGACK